MSGSALNKYLQPKEPRPDETVLEEAGGLDDLVAFGFLRGTHDRALMLELRHKDGEIDAFPYAWLSHATFDPSEGIVLRFGSNTVNITGRNLNAEVRANVRLFQAIVRHRVPWIQEADEPTALEAPQNAVLIERIDVNE